MNQSVALHIVERLESFVGKLPASIQNPVLSELTPLKDLFLRQRSPRFVLTGSDKLSVLNFVTALYRLDGAHDGPVMTLAGLHRWQTVTAGSHGTAEVLDARCADSAAVGRIQDELRRQPPDLFFRFATNEEYPVALASDAERIASQLSPEKSATVVIRLREARGTTHEGESAPTFPAFDLPFPLDHPLSENARAEMQRLSAFLARALPNDARVEMVRLSGDRAAQLEIARILVKSTSAVCGAIGAQPIPLADLPILTALQLLMVAGIMYISGRERSLRAATEFIGALGANVGAGMILREGTRALVKFFPGWGNVVSGMVAGAGTYAIGRSATLFFLEDASLKEARQAFLRYRKDRVPKRGKALAVAGRDREHPHEA
jgi:uncharacterized protein (DUF697 family)